MVRGSVQKFDNEIMTFTYCSKILSAKGFVLFDKFVDAPLSPNSKSRLCFI